MRSPRGGYVWEGPCGDRSPARPGQHTDHGKQAREPGEIPPHLEGRCVPADNPTVESCGPTAPRCSHEPASVRHTCPMRHSAVFLLAIAALGACNDSDPSTSPQNTLQTKTVMSRPVPLPAVDPEWRVSFVESQWIRDKSSAADRLVVRTVDIPEPGCQNFDHADIEETATTITIHTFLRILTPTRPDQGCDAIGLGLTLLDVPLRQPLGDRQLNGDCDDLRRLDPSRPFPSALMCEYLRRDLPIGR